MIKATSKVKINNMRIKQLTSAATIALEQTGEVLHEEIVQAQVVPRDTGNLQGESFFADYTNAKKGKVSLIHATPYARRLYYHPEYKFHKEPWTDEKGKRHEGNANARGKWFEPWISGKEKNFAKKTFKEFFKKAGGV